VTLTASTFNLFVQVEVLLAIQTRYEFSRSLANRSSHAAGIDLYRPAF
jgi:hypothetical protein